MDKSITEIPEGKYCYKHHKDDAHKEKEKNCPFYNDCWCVFMRDVVEKKQKICEVNL